MVGDYYFRKLPRRVQGRIEELVRSIEAAAGADLVSVLAYGSVARDDWSESTSNVDLLVVLKRAPREVLGAMSDALALARASARVETTILVEAEIAGSGDVSPLFFQDVREHHVVLHGSDPFAGLVIEDAHVRLRVEQELRDVAIHLRSSVVDARGDRALLGAAVARKLRKIRSPLRVLLRLMGEEPSDDYRVILEKASRKFRVDAASLAHPTEKPEAAHDELALLLERAIAAVDELQLGDKP